jgi:hypothetical protein
MVTSIKIFILYDNDIWQKKQPGALQKLFLGPDLLKNDWQ